MKVRLGRLEGSKVTLKSLGEKRKTLEEERRGEDEYEVEGDRTRLLIVIGEFEGEERKVADEGADEDNRRMGEEAVLLRTGNAECLLLKLPLPSGELRLEVASDDDDDESEVMI